MPAGIVEALMAVQVSDQIVPLSSLALFKSGEKVQVLEGAFAGNVAIYEKMTAEDRVQILLDIFISNLLALMETYALLAFLHAMPRM